MSTEPQLMLALKGRGRYVTGLVKSLSLHGPEWTYEMWPRPEGEIIGDE
jgi:hypothetical protein